MEAKAVDDLINDLREVRDELFNDADILQKAANILEDGMYRRYQHKDEVKE